MPIDDFPEYYEYHNRRRWLEKCRRARRYGDDDLEDEPDNLRENEHARGKNE